MLASDHALLSLSHVKTEVSSSSSSGYWMQLECAPVPFVTPNEMGVVLMFLILTWHWRMVFFYSTLSHSILQPGLWSGQSRDQKAGMQHLHATWEWSLWIACFRICVSHSISRLETGALGSLLASSCRGVHGKYPLDLLCWVGSDDDRSLFCLFHLHDWC